jgi:5-(carboxyamino)imidazole ribonucleotide mutase
LTIRSDEEIVQKQLHCGPLVIDLALVNKLKTCAAKAFAVVEKAWKALDVTLVDFKVEFGVTQEGQIILADVIDNDSWRIWLKGDPSLMKDKQVYRNLPIGQLSDKDKEMLVQNYAWVAEQPLIDAILEMNVGNPLVAIIMGSQSDWETMKNASDMLDKLGISYEARIVSAHRTPERMFAFAKTAKEKGFKVIIAGAGGAAHLPGMVSSLTTLPVLGVPIQSKALSGMDSLLSIAQMPGGVPVGTLAIGAAGATNAALLAASILAASGKYPDICESLEIYRNNQTASVADFPKDETCSSSTATLPAPTPMLQGLTVSKRFDTKKPLPPGSVIGIIGGGNTKAIKFTYLL